MENITNACLYQECTKPSTYIITCASTMHQHLYHTKHQPYTTTCIMNLYHIMYQSCTMYQPCTSTRYINTISCTNYIPYNVIHHIPINQDMNQQCISPIRPQPTCTMHQMMCVKSYTKSHKHMLLACSSISPRCNLITQYTKPQV
jgi:hypothetical protein